MLVDEQLELLDPARIDDAAYREDMRHRCMTDHFFLARLMGFHDFHSVLHKPAVELFFPKNPNLPIAEQDPIKNRLYLDPRGVFKTTLGRIDKLQWILSHPETVTILNQSAEQGMAKDISVGIANYFCRYKIVTPIQRLFPELVVDKWPFHNDQDGWNTPVKDLRDIDPTIRFTSPASKQSGKHPWIINADDMVETTNSGIHAKDETRRKVIDTFDTNRNTLRRGGYVYLVGTRYHPFDLYGVRLNDMDPAKWKVLVRTAVTVKNGQRLVPGEFPEEDELVCNFKDLPGMDYSTMRDLFYANYESFMCFCAGSRVLMGDFSEKPIEKLKVGDEVIGFEKVGPYNTRLVKTKVVRLFVRRAEAVEFRTDTGREIQATPDHRFLKVPNRKDLEYAPLKMGSKVVSVYTPSAPPTNDEQRDLDWLGGMFDGEGSIGKVGIALHQHLEKNPEISAAIHATLNRLGISYSIGKTHSTHKFSLHGGRSLMIRLLQSSRMAKVDRIRKALFGGKQISETCGRRGGETHPQVVSIESLGEQTVYDIETETHNFVCEGFAVHNCQQQNDPQGGAVPVFDEKLWNSCQVPIERIPPYRGEVFICWRLAFTGKKNMAYTEGAAARIIDGRVSIIDCWKGNWNPSRTAERIVQAQKQHNADGMMILQTPGSEYMAHHIRNEAMRRNLSLKLQWVEWEESGDRRDMEVKQLEPLMKVGRLQFATGMTKGTELRKQVVHFGLIEENGMIECVSKLANLVPMSQMRAHMQESEIEWHRRRNDDALVETFMKRSAIPQIDEMSKQKTIAHQRAMEAATRRGPLPPMPGGLDG